MIIDVFCKSGRHRSVGEATSLAIILQHLGIKFKPTLVHCEARERGRGWLTMHCKGRRMLEDAKSADGLCEGIDLAVIVVRYE